MVWTFQQFGSDWNHLNISCLMRRRPNCYLQMSCLRIILATVLLFFASPHFDPPSISTLTWNPCKRADSIRWVGVAAAPIVQEMGGAPQNNEREPMQVTNDTLQSRTNSVEDVIEGVELEVDCDTVEPFSRDAFVSYPEMTKVYLSPRALNPGSIFEGLGFTKFVSIFGVPIVAEETVSDELLRHAGGVFAQFLDNDRDGVADRPDTLKAIQSYNTVIGYVQNATSSEDFWTVKFVDPASSRFREQFVCRMHFFEQWASDATPEYHKVRFEAAQTAGHLDEGATALELAGQECTDAVRQTDFDWALWYFPFTMTYYGYLEDFNEATLLRTSDVMEKAKKLGVFVGNKFPEDDNMELSDFIAWSLITAMGALKCHCESDTISEVWKMCSAEDVKKFDIKWYEFLRGSKGLPTVLPDGNYQSPATEGTTANEIVNGSGGEQG